MRKQYCLHLEENNHKMIKVLAAEKGCSVSDIMNILIEKYIGNDGKK